MSKAKTLTEEERETSGWALFVILLMVIVVWWASGWLLSSMPERGTFGDMFGAINALFSGLAFATLIYTVFLQRRELQLQRQELTETKVELKRTAAAQEASEAALRAQAEASELAATLTATHTLLTYYREARAEFMQRSVQLEPDTPRKIEFLQKKEEPLYAMLEETYQQITKAHAARRQTNSGISTDPPTPEN